MDIQTSSQFSLDTGHIMTSKELRGLGGTQSGTQTRITRKHKPWAQVETSESKKAEGRDNRITDSWIFQRAQGRKRNQSRARKSNERDSDQFKSKETYSWREIGAEGASETEHKRAEHSSKNRGKSNQSRPEKVTREISTVRASRLWRNTAGRSGWGDMGTAWVATAISWYTCI